MAKPNEPRNIIWVGEGEPQEVIATSEHEIRLPSGAEQRAGFYHPLAGLILRLVDGYKEFREDKGSKEA
jgi:hypothetical protein